MKTTQDRINEAKRLLNLVKYYGLSGEKFLANYSIEQLAQDYNGIGPAFFPESLRNAIDALHPDLKPCAFVHDPRWSHADGSLKQFIASNDEFELNGKIIACAKYSWYDPRRYIRMRQARIFANLCRVFGWLAYRSACRQASIIILAFAAFFVGCNNPPKTRTIDVAGMYANAATETVAIGSVEVIAAPQGEETAVVRYKEDTAWLSPSTKTHNIDIVLTGTNTTGAITSVVESISKALKEVGAKKLDLD